MSENRPSDLAMKIAVAMEVHCALSTTTIAKGRTIDEMLNSHDAAPDMVEAMKPLVDFIEAFERKPLGQIDDEFYGIHAGTEWEASIRFSDFRKLRDAYNKARGQS